MPVTHAKHNNEADWTQAQLDAQIAAGNFPPGTRLADIVLPGDWNAAHAVSVGVSEINATGTPSNTTYLRGDGTWSSVGGGVSSFNARTGAVTPASGDYTFSQVGGTAAIAQGGTGQSTAAGALNALLPGQTGNAGKFITTNGTSASWGTGVTGPAGADSLGFGFKFIADTTGTGTHPAAGKSGTPSTLSGSAGSLDFSTTDANGNALPNLADPNLFPYGGTALWWKQSGPTTYAVLQFDAGNLTQVASPPNYYSLVATGITGTFGSGISSGDVVYVEFFGGRQGPTGATGPMGAAGSSGNVWYVGSYNGNFSGIPGTPNPNDMLLDTATWDLYFYSTGYWNFLVNVIGPAGATGAAGSNGSNGATGATGSPGPNVVTVPGGPDPATGTNATGLLYGDGSACQQAAVGTGLSFSGGTLSCTVSPAAPGGGTNDVQVNNGSGGFSGLTGVGSGTGVTLTFDATNPGSVTSLTVTNGVVTNYTTL